MDWLNTFFYALRYGVLKSLFELAFIAVAITVLFLILKFIRKDVL